MNFNDLVAPFDQRYCAYFYYIMLFFIILFVVVIAMAIYSLAFNPQKMPKTQVLFYHFSMLINILLAYFVNRLFYSMCMKSLKK
jgi:hypothetical protein